MDEGKEGQADGHLLLGHPPCQITCFHGAHPTFMTAHRAGKWLSMLKAWPAFTRRHPQRTKRRIRKGIPDIVRRQARGALLGCSFPFHACTCLHLLYVCAFYAHENNALFTAASSPCAPFPSPRRIHATNTQFAG